MLRRPILIALSAVALCAGAPAWDGRWLILLITIPHELRAVRKKLYGALSWAGFGSLGPQAADNCACASQGPMYR